jgi:hypothetical protein
MLKRTHICAAIWHEACCEIPIRHVAFGLGLLAGDCSFGGEVGNSASPKTKGMQMESLIDGLAEVRRERLIRTTVYPRLISQGKLTEGEASRRLDALLSAELLLQSMLSNWETVSQLIELPRHQTPKLRD